MLLQKKCIILHLVTLFPLLTLPVFLLYLQLLFITVNTSLLVQQEGHLEPFTYDKKGLKTKNYIAKGNL